MTTDLHQATAFVIEALPADVLADARAQLAAADDRPRRCPAPSRDRRRANPLLPARRDAGGASPAAQQSTTAARAEPYQETGAVFAHAEAADCPGHEPSDRYPQGWRGRPQVLRAYDGQGFIHPATRVHDGTAPEQVIAELLSDPDVVLVHSRNVAYGCYMFVVRPGVRR